jgi:putative transposase
MSHSFHNGFYHFVWATWDRQPLLTEDIESHAYALIRQQCQLMKVKIVALGGLSDHVHLLVTVPTTLCLADFMENVKGATCHALNKAHAAPAFSFKWQRGYGYHTVSASHLGIVRRYIEQQKDRHINEKLWRTCEPPQPHVPANDPQVGE